MTNALLPSTGSAGLPLDPLSLADVVGTFGEVVTTARAECLTRDLRLRATLGGLTEALFDATASDPDTTEAQPVDPSLIGAVGWVAIERAALLLQRRVADASIGQRPCTSDVCVALAAVHDAVDAAVEQRSRDAVRAIVVLAGPSRPLQVHDTAAALARDQVTDARVISASATVRACRLSASLLDRDIRPEPLQIPGGLFHDVVEREVAAGVDAVYLVGGRSRQGRAVRRRLRREGVDVTTI